MILVVLTRHGNSVYYTIYEVHIYIQILPCAIFLSSLKTRCGVASAQNTGIHPGTIPVTTQEASRRVTGTIL